MSQEDIPSDREPSGIAPAKPKSRLSNAAGTAVGKVAFATVLTALSGFVDAVGYAQLGHLYLSFMSGNSTHLGMSLADLDWPDALLAAALIASFVAGVSFGTILSDRYHGSLLRVVLGSELAIVGGAVALNLAGQSQVALIMVAAGMGMQNTLHQIVAEADIGKGFITGNLFSLGQALGRLSRGSSQGVLVAQHALSWLAFLAGVVIGTLAFVQLGLTACLSVTAFFLTCLIAATNGRTI